MSLVEDEFEEMVALAGTLRLDGLVNYSSRAFPILLPPDSQQFNLQRERR